MKLSEKLTVIAEWLSDPNNEILLEAESVGENELNKIVDAFVLASEVIKLGSEELKGIEVNVSAEVAQPSIGIDESKLEELAAVASMLDATGDEELIKKASVLDEILLTICSPKDYAFNFKKAEEAKIEELRKNYKEPEKMLEAKSKAQKLVEQSQYYKERRPLEAALKTRNCPDHPGVMMLKGASDDTLQCPMDGKEYNYATGFSLMNGDKVPGGEVANQSDTMQDPGNLDFDTRQSRSGLNNL